MKTRIRIARKGDILYKQHYPGDDGSKVVYRFNKKYNIVFDYSDDINVYLCNKNDKNEKPLKELKESKSGRYAVKAKGIYTHYCIVKISNSNGYKFTLPDGTVVE